MPMPSVSSCDASSPHNSYLEMEPTTLLGVKAKNSVLAHIEQGGCLLTPLLVATLCRQVQVVGNLCELVL